MIHTMLPIQYLQRTCVRSDPHRRLMAAVLQTVVDDCRASERDAARATAYISSDDRTWPFSFTNLCDALGMDAASLRKELDSMVVAELTDPAAGVGDTGRAR